MNKEDFFNQIIKKCETWEKLGMKTMNQFEYKMDILNIFREAENNNLSQEINLDRLDDHLESKNSLLSNNTIFKNLLKEVGDLWEAWSFFKQNY